MVPQLPEVPELSNRYCGNEDLWFVLVVPAVRGSSNDQINLRNMKTCERNVRNFRRDDEVLQLNGEDRLIPRGVLSELYLF